MKNMLEWILSHRLVYISDKNHNAVALIKANFFVDGTNTFCSTSGGQAQIIVKIIPIGIVEGYYFLQVKGVSEVMIFKILVDHSF